MDTRRFNRPEYKKQIHAVRAYKRRSQPLPETKVAKTMRAIGLGTVFRLVLAGLGLALLIYLIYFAPILRLNNVEVSGTSDEIGANVKNQFAEYIKGYNFIFPRKNFFFFSASQFSNYLLQNNLQVLSVKDLQYKFPHGIVLQLNPRIPTYVFQSANNSYVLNSDGKISSQLSQNSGSANSSPTSSANPNLPLIVDNSSENISLGQQIFDQRSLDFIAYAQQNLNMLLSQPVDHYEIATVASKQLTIYAKNGVKFIFDSSTDPKVYFGRLLALWNQFSPDQQKKLAYIDLRFDPNVYTCNRGDKCSQ